MLSSANSEHGNVPRVAQRKWNAIKSKFHRNFPLSEHLKFAEIPLFAHLKFAEILLFAVLKFAEILLFAVLKFALREFYAFLMPYITF